MDITSRIAWFHIEEQTLLRNYFAVNKIAAVLAGIIKEKKELEGKDAV